MHQKLTRSEQVAIAAAAGMGGVGKTALARAYVRERAAAYPGGIWWLRLKSLDIVTEVLSAAAFFGWEVPDLPQVERRIAWCWQQWQQASPGRRLLVLDDVADYSKIRAFLPTDGSFRVLLTSRVRFGQPVDRLDLEVMKRAEAFRTFRRYVGDDDRIRADVGTAKQILAWLGYLPLGIELVGKYLENHPSVDLAKAWQRLQEKRLDAKALSKLPDERTYEYNVRAALELSWQELSPLAQRVAGLLAVFALAPIEKGWIEASLPDVDEEDLEEALDGELVRGSVVQFLEGGTYQLHQLVREYLTDQLQTELAADAEDLRRGMAIALTQVAKTTPQTVTLQDLERLETAIPHLAWVAESFSALLPDDDAGWPFIALARLAAGQSRWAEAERWYTNCFTMSESRFGADHPSVATSLNNLALLYYAMGRYAEAEPLFARSLAIREQQLGANHPAVATSLNNLASLYDSMGRYGEAEPLYLRALAIQFKTLPEDHPYNKAGFNNFVGLVRAALESGQADQLSDHPLTQDLLRQISEHRDESEP